MTPRHFRFWPKGLPKSLSFPRTPLHELLEVSARRYPHKPASWFFGAALSYREAEDQVLRLAGFLQQGCGVRPGDRVLVDLQNSPQFLLAAYAISRADAVMVPVSPMCVADELAHYIEDSGARVAIVGQEVWPRLAG
ncbi:MAG: AMP-binding protein, partial [Burkholderiales bacterium]